MIYVGWVCAAMVAVFAITTFAVRWPLPLTLLLTAVVGALLAGFGVPFRHLVEGGFGYLNLILALFAGAVFGQVMRVSGAADALADCVAALNARVLPLLLSGILLFVTGMFTGIAGVAVIAVGAFAAPLLQRAGLTLPISAAYIALMGTLGMIAPPLNVPAMVMADGVNMPYAGFALSLWTLSLPTALFVFATFTRRASPSVSTAGLSPFPSTGRWWVQPPFWQ